MVEKYFQEVVLAVEQSIKHGAGGRADYLNTLQHIYRDILTASEEGVCSALYAVLAHIISMSREKEGFDRIVLSLLCFLRNNRGRSQLCLQHRNALSRDQLPLVGQ